MINIFLILKSLFNIHDVLYVFEYNPDIDESCARTMSIHKTYKGAYMALRSFLLYRHEEWFGNPRKYHELYCIEHTEHYFIRKMKLKD